MATMVEQVRIDITGDNKKLTSSLNDSKRKVRSFTKIAKAGMKAIGVAAAAAGAAIGAAALKGVKDFSKFEEEMGQVSTLTDISAKKIKGMGREVLQLAVNTGQTDFTSMTKGLYDIISAGIPAANATKFLAVATDAATAGATSVATAVDGLTSVVNAYGKDLGGTTDKVKQAKVANDIFFNTIKLGKTTFSELATGVGQIAPIASQVGVSFEQIGAAIATMTTAGVKTDSAVTQIKQVLTSVIKPTSDAAKTAKTLGIQFNLAALKAQGMQKFLTNVYVAAKGNTTILSKLFGNVRALAGVMALTGKQSQKYADFLKKIKNGAGAADEAVSKMQEGISFKIKKMTAFIKAASVSLGAGFADAVMKVDSSALDETASKLQDIEQLGQVVGRTLVASFYGIRTATNLATIAIMKTYYAVKKLAMIQKIPGIETVNAFGDKKTAQFTNKTGYSPSIWGAIKAQFQSKETVRRQQRQRIEKYFSPTNMQRQKEDEAYKKEFFSSLWKRTGADANKSMSAVGGIDIATLKSIDSSLKKVAKNTAQPAQKKKMVVVGGLAK